MGPKPRAGSTREQKSNPTHLVRRPPNQTPTIIQPPAAKNLVYLSRYLAWRERLDEMQLGMQAAGTRAVMATLQAIQPDWIALTPRVILESPRAHMFSQYLCGTETPDSAHIIHEVKINDRHGEMERVRALIDCCATSIFMAPNYFETLGYDTKQHIQPLLGSTDK